MGDNAKAVEPKTEKQLVDEFVKDYESICEKHQMRIVTTPVYKARDDNTFSLVLQTSVGKLPKPEQQ